MDVKKIIEENKRRNDEMFAPFDPVVGIGSFGDRVWIEIPDFPIPRMYVPKVVANNKLIKAIIKSGSIKDFVLDELDAEEEDVAPEVLQREYEAVCLEIILIRSEEDFLFWAAFLVEIKGKGGGDNIMFKLNYPQRKLASRFEEKRINLEPIRLILLKARQWGGSTATQIYMAWLQLIHMTGLNSLIVGHVKDAAIEVKDMFDRMLNRYPIELMVERGESFNPNDAKLRGVGRSANIHRIPQRNCKIKIGTAEKPDSARGGDYNLVHCTEVGLWEATEGKTPEEIVRSACSGIAMAPYTMIVYESTANGTGNFFHTEYTAAKEGSSQFEALFIPWYDIELYRLPLDDEEGFARWLYENKDNENVMSNREECGKYLWWLWTKGATLEGINWYIQERKKYNDHAHMAAEYPSDDIEAFVHSGQKVFDMYQVEEFRSACRAPKYIGDVRGDGVRGKEVLQNLRFSEDKQGLLWVWAKPEVDDTEKVLNRYLVVVDIGGRSNKADYSVIVVIDRLNMIDGLYPTVVAQWYGHTDMDLLAWKAVQVAAYYDNALLVIEKNTLDTKDPARLLDGDSSTYILSLVKDVYENLYARKQSADEVREGIPKVYGFHTNVKTKPDIINNLQNVIRDKLYVERDSRCLDEYLTYEKKPNGKWEAIEGKHDDLLMTRAIGLWVCFFDMDYPKIVDLSQKRQSFTKVLASEADF
jgi:hypothetical protein